MRKIAMTIAAALIATAPVAHAGPFGGSLSASESTGASAETQNRPSVLSVIVERLNASMISLNANSASAPNEKKSAAGKACAEADKTASRKSADKLSGGEDTDMTEPTGPEPIYFGF